MQMYRLLIVDDEPYTVDGLYEMLQEMDWAELDLYKAYSANEAIEWLNRVKIDIVLSDIRMPGMDGLQLHRHIKATWPRCKVIFLTGMNEMKYIQQALRDGSVDYILKTEGDEPILRSVRGTIEALEEELKNDRYLQHAKLRIQQALPGLRNGWFMQLLQYGIGQARLSQARLAEMESPLDSDSPLLPVLARVDRWPERISDTDRPLLLFAIENIAVETLAEMNVQSVIIDDYYLMLMIQTKQPISDERIAGDGDRAGAVRFVQGMLETVQSTCTQLLQLPVSIICGRAFVPWEQIADTYFRMRKKLVLGVGQGENMMLLAKTGCISEKQGGGGAAAMPSRLREQLDVALESGRSEEASSAIDACFANTSEYARYLEAYYTVANQLIGLINRWGWAEQLERDGEIRLEQLMNVQGHSSREQAVDYLRFAANRLISYKQGVKDERTERIVEKINRYIREQIGGDLSLTVLAEVVYLNPAYLSVLYKQTTGQNISEFIVATRLEKAKDLLQRSPCKIHEVAAAVGFDNPGYFTRFFRKHAGIGPQEYREQASL
ncbi:response regulator [Paenibacillus spongiae]|uniref:Response regulator n=1 Tax=Paenibacillus spongiae TaxID=2909671 RepID=A0ABY5SIE3_9BACL|nr:response regulator [Paenibacillus spongiae]UVI32023.1 response regulator [Paenibacillus spongiae]